MERAELKALAKGRLGTQVGVSAGVMVVYLVIAAVTAPTVIGPILLTGPLWLGMATYFLRLARSEQPMVATLFAGFSRFTEALKAWLLQLVFVFLWTLLLVVPGVIAALRYSQTWFVLADHPELSARQAIERSKELTEGSLGELFVLYLSFFWWFLLAAVTFGLGWLYVGPYVQSTLALYYEGLKARKAIPA